MEVVASIRDLHQRGVRLLSEHAVRQFWVLTILGHDQQCGARDGAPLIPEGTSRVPEGIDHYVGIKARVEAVRVLLQSVGPGSRPGVVSTEERNRRLAR